MDVLMLIITIIGGILSVLIDLYLLILYVHRDQQKLRPINIFCMILIVLTLLQVQLQPLFLLFDVLSSRQNGTDFTILWVVVYFSIFVNIAFLKPLATSLYEADEEDNCCKRFCWTIVQVIISMACFGTFLGLGWLFWGKVYIPIEQISVDAPYGGGWPVQQSVSDSYIQIQVTVPCFLVGMLCLIGYPILACCGACGLTALPFSLFIQFKNRPKWKRSHEAREQSQFLKAQTVRLIKQADKARRKINRSDFIDGWFAKSRKNKELENQVTQLQNKLADHLDRYQLFRAQLDMANTNPWVYILKLIAGVLCVIIAPIWFIQILLVQLVFNQSTFLDKFFVYMEDQNASFISIAFILILTLYMIIAILKGIFFFSQALPVFKIHPMQEGKTWLNSFLFQATIAVISATSMVHLMVTTFPQYLRGGDIALMMGSIIEGMLFIGVFIYHKVFIYIFLIMSVLGGIFSAFVLICIRNKPEALKRLDDLKKKFSKKIEKERKKQQQAIEMTEMNLNDKKQQPTKSSHKKKKKTIKLAFTD